ncbi:acyl-CoA dehydrogenase family protein [Stenotrophobium rhamnosiphilum]|uniref:Acyl-CoA dehydrogenase n=1 Tax=Stenotrophobium rhamnosiphilum TaxID=2029166 RepID=A0A2T5MGZ2_9GAMM|nr:acyl-CoA dehydrogenase family protein [Stenotrophobium rhamnosiphilum]PTU31846.1 acyl-CoA dehydrogenase [Stenotrophobium rhamnosiphilum]
MIPRSLFTPEHEDFRRTFRRFVDEEMVPHHERWEEQQCVDRAIWNRAGELGFLCVTMDEAYGGAGADRLYSVAMIEEMARAGVTGSGFMLHSDIVANYINNFANEQQKLQWLPRMATGELVGAIAMTEPGTGSDLQAIRTTAIEDGDHYILNGSKTFITNGYLSDLVVVVVRTGNSGEGSKDLSLLLVKANSPGFTKGKPLKKIGMKAQDTCELFFENVRVPKENLLGKAGSGFIALMQELAWERLIIAITSIATGEAALQHTIEYTQNRKVFGKPVASYQNTRFKLADIKAQLVIGRVYVDRCLELLLNKQLGADDSAIAKLWCSELVDTVIDECLQLHGGNGYMLEYPIARAYIDSRAQRIYGGTNEIMKELIARTL